MIETEDLLQKFMNKLWEKSVKTRGEVVRKEGQTDPLLTDQTRKEGGPRVWRG